MGAGFSGAAVAQTQANFGRLLVEDSLWSAILLHFGILGVAVVAVTLAVGIGTGVLAALRRRTEPLALAAVGAAALVWLFARTAASAEIMMNYPLVCAFLLALVTVEARDAWSASQGVERLLLGRGDAPALPERMRRSVLFKAAAVALAVVVEIAIGRVIAR